LKLICFDCDSTLSSIEGIDELARLRGPEVFRRIEILTEDAMNGKIRIEDVFGLRLEAIRPTQGDVACVGPTAKAAIAALSVKGWTPLIISGGFRQAIRPLADHLGVPQVEAVDLFFREDGSYAGFDTAFPSTRSGGKTEIIRRIRAELRPEKVVMVGDGASDLETLPAVDLFVGFGGFVTRENVRREAPAFVTSLAGVLALV
jgi:phosphoserine phosphatase